MSGLFDGADVIHSYSRAQAIEDGVLVDAGDLAREAGFVYPVALTRAAWEDCVAWDDETAERTGAVQDETGRLWDVLNMTRFAIGRSGGGSEMRVELRRVRADRRTGGRAHRVLLKAVCGPGDAAEPVITIMLPDES